MPYTPPMADFIFDRAKNVFSASAGVTDFTGGDSIEVTLLDEPYDPAAYADDFRGAAKTFGKLGEGAADATASFEEFGDRMRSEAGWQPRSSKTFPPVFLWLPLLKIGRVIMTLRLDTGRLMTTRPRWDEDQSELIGTFQVNRPGRVVGVVISDDRGTLLYADDDIDVTCVPGADFVVALTIAIV